MRYGADLSRAGSIWQKSHAARGGVPRLCPSLLALSQPDRTDRPPLQRNVRCVPKIAPFRNHRCGRPSCVRSKWLRPARSPAATPAATPATPKIEPVKRIGFLSFGHWQNAPGSQTPTASEALNQTIELAEAAEKIGIDGAYVRVHHFARQLASPFPLLAAIGARTSRIEIGTAVIDMRYENPLYMAEDAAAADLIAGGRLQLGLSRGSPEPALNGAHSFGYVPPEGQSDADAAREKTALFRHAINGAGVVRSDRAMTGGDFSLPIQPQSPGLHDRIWWGSGTRETARWAAAQGMNLQSSTLLVEDTGVPFGELQAEQIDLYRDAWIAAGWEREPRVSVSRSVLPIVTDADRLYFGGRAADGNDQLGQLDGTTARFGRSYTGEPDVIAAELAKDPAVQMADTVLLTVPNQLGVEYCAAMLETIARYIAPAFGWSGDTADEQAANDEEAPPDPTSVGEASR
jgi:alkanesulfonate monooxygenase SsuD/methylene tetrahydromethanopterin reductase-like flavin-dependent oxidoreductase (luciferase family)